MRIAYHSEKAELGKAAADEGARAISAAIAERGSANVVLATGASQFEMLDTLVRKDIDWSRVTAFHLDEYVGLAPTHPASFRRYLRERFVEKVGPLQKFEFVAGDAEDINAEVARLNASIAQCPIDVCFAGIGENCHLAFNDPPADFETDAPFLVVDLDDACRRQQLGEGWFATFEDVPKQAVSMSIKQIMASRLIVLSVSDERKATAVRNAVEGAVSPDHPASILQRHPNAVLHLDTAAAADLTLSRA